MQLEFSTDDLLERDRFRRSYRYPSSPRAAKPCVLLRMAIRGAVPMPFLSRPRIAGSLLLLAAAMPSAHAGLSPNALIGNALTFNALTSNSLSFNAVTSNALNFNALTSNALSFNALTVNALTSNSLSLNSLTFNALSINGLTMNALLANAVTQNALVANALSINAIAATGAALADLNGVTIDGIALPQEVRP
jgi:hypothetical protein